VTVADTTGPNLQNVPPHLTVEANGPAGSKVNFATPVAVDLVDGLIAGVSCSPASGSTFALGTRTVTCSRADSRGNAGSASFQVTVADRTPPTVLIPVSLGIHATSREGISRLNPVISAWLASASAADIVDPTPVVANNAPLVLPIGTTDVTFTARDAGGNATSRSSSIVVLPQPAPGTPPIAPPPVPKQPDNPANVTATPGSGTVKLSWSAVPGAKEYLVYRSTQETLRLSAVGHGQLVYRGTARTFTDRGLTNGVEYRYVVVVEDAAGNESVGVALVVVPRRDLLKSPKNGARLKKAPRLVWAADAEADYYNAQLLLGGVKVLSAWPTRPQLRLKKTWRFSGRKYTLKPGLYTWYVWPGYGARASVDYGELLGSRTFRIVR
jgi:HYR domain